MALSDDDYRDLLNHARTTLRRNGLGALDERVVQANQEPDGPYWDLMSYFRLLIAELSLGSDEQLSTMLRRVRRVSSTESGDPVQGFRLELTPDEARRYNVSQVDFAPSPVVSETVAELQAVLDDLRSDRESRPEPG